MKYKYNRVYKGNLEKVMQDLNVHIICVGSGTTINLTQNQLSAKEAQKVQYVPIICK